MYKLLRIKNIATLTAALFFFTACGGGGGGSTSIPVSGQSTSDPVSKENTISSDYPEDTTGIYDSVGTYTSQNDIIINTTNGAIISIPASSEYIDDSEKILAMSALKVGMQTFNADIA